MSQMLNKLTIEALQEAILEIKRLESLLRRTTASGPCTIRNCEEIIKLLVLEGV